MPRVVSIRIDGDKGSIYPLKCNVIKDSGIEGDRQRDLDRAISIIDNRFIVNKTTSDLGFCTLRFKENLIIDELDLSVLDTNVILKIGSAKLQLSAKGKKCHSDCPKYKTDRSCVLYKHVAFARILENGVIQKYDEVIIV